MLVPTGKVRSGKCQSSAQASAIFWPPFPLLYNELLHRQASGASACTHAHAVQCTTLPVEVDVQLRRLFKLARI
jgi:hypothetical protein